MAFFWFFGWLRGSRAQGKAWMGFAAVLATFFSEACQASS